ncbi:MAG: hypothetical protein AB1425_17025, partial [Actinomycetota bacterium]
VLARLTGAGVTLPVAAASPLLVLGAGVMLRRWLGPVKKSDPALATPPNAPDALSLALVALSLALIVVPGLLYTGTLWLAVECRGWPGEICEASGAAQPFALSAAILAGMAGILHMLRSAGPDESRFAPEDREPRETRTAPALRLALPAVLLLALARGYGGVALHDWPFIRGLDHYSHAVMANRMMTVGEIQPYLIYPPGFHTMTAIVSRLTGIEPLDVFPLLGPACFLLPALACYALGRRLWGPPYGVAAAFFAGTLMGGIYYYFNDAMYPNLTASQFLLPMTVLALARLYHAPDLRNGLLVAVLGSSVVLYHQVTSLYLALLLATVSASALPYLLLRDRRRGVALFLSLSLLAALSTAYAWKTYDLPRIAASLLGLAEEGETREAVEMAVGTQNAYDLGALTVAIVSQPVTWLGLLGAIFLALDPEGWSRGLPERLVRATVLLWVAILFAGSRTSYSGFPQRFGRDLGVPLSLLAGLALVLVLAALLKQRRMVGILAASLTVALAASLTGLRAIQSYDQATAPSPHLTMSAGIYEAGEWLQAHNRGGNVMISPQANQVPSRMMLAMSGYSALQSFTQAQVENPRDLPPTGPEPLRDVLYVMNNPADERTGELFEKHGVDYVVLYKEMPDRDVVPFWEGFAERPDIYEPVFENEDVLIVERRRGSSST